MRSSYGIIPGSLKERKVIDRITAVFKELVDQVSLIDIPVYTWSSDCTIRVGSEERECALLPYSSPGNFEVRAEEILIGDLESLLKVNLKEKVVVTDYPKTPSDLRWAVYSLSTRGVKAIILLPEFPLALKSDVVLGSPGFTYTPTVPLSLPVISVNREISSLLLKSGFELEAHSEILRAESKIVVGHINGSSEYEAHLSSHHDVIVGEFESTPTSLLISALREMKKSNLALPLNLVVISYTARDIGDVEFTEYHFTWGERYLLRVMSARGDLDNVILSASIGPIQSKDITVVAHPILVRHLPRKLVVSDNHAFLESHNYLEHGVPALTITSLPATWAAHNAMIGSTVSINRTDLEGRVTNLVLHVLRSTRPVDDWINDLRKYMITSIGEQRVEVRVEASKIVDFFRQSGLIKGVKGATKYSHSLIYVMCSSPFKAWAKSSPFAQISNDVVEVLKSCVEHCTGDLILGSSKRFNTFRLGEISRPARENFLNLYLETIIMDLKDIVDNALARAKLLEAALKGSESGGKTDYDKGH